MKGGVKVDLEKELKTADENLTKKRNEAIVALSSYGISDTDSLLKVFDWYSQAYFEYGFAYGQYASVKGIGEENG